MTIFKTALLRGCFSLATICIALGTAQAETKPTSKGGKMTTVIIETSMGNIEAELNADKAPKSVENFLKYVKSGHYNGTIFHRVIDGFMIQGGGMTEAFAQKKTEKPIELEANNGLKNERGTLAMARTGDPHSATSQFFINVADNAFLNQKSTNPPDGYTVFGKVTAGMDVVDKIKVVPTHVFQNVHENAPKTNVVIKSVKVK